MDCITKTVKTGGITGLYRGSAITVAGAFVYRGGQLGLFAQIQDMNPYKSDKGMVGIVAAFVCATVARTITVSKNEGLGGVYKGLIPELFRGLGGPLVLT